jgi:hypothetical protein
MFSIKDIKQYYHSLYPSSKNVHPLGGFFLFTIALALGALLIVLIYPTFYNNDEQQQQTIIKMRVDAVRFIEAIKRNYSDLSEEFDWIDRFPNAIKFLNMQLQTVEYIHLIRHIFAAYNTLLMEILLPRQIAKIRLIIPIVFSVIGGYFDVITNAVLFTFFQFLQLFSSWFIFALFLNDYQNTESRPSTVRNNNVNVHFHHMYIFIFLLRHCYNSLRISNRILIVRSDLTNFTLASVQLYDSIQEGD